MITSKEEENRTKDFKMTIKNELKTFSVWHQLEILDAVKTEVAESVKRRMDELRGHIDERKRLLQLLSEKTI